MYLAFAFVLLHLHWHLRQFFNIFFLFLWRWCWSLALREEIRENPIKDRLVIIGLDCIVGGHLVSLGLGLHVGLRSKDLQRVLHLVELQQLLDQLQSALPLRALSQLLHLQVFSVEGGGLNGSVITFLEEPSCESMVLNTEDRICARMLLR
jgi:hypothetical protein